ncbi:MAG: PP2C family protein-serine/threonine phosphatase [Mariprofundaceae bacterium]
MNPVSLFHTSLWRYLAVLWPLLAVLISAQLVMRWSGNSHVLGLTWPVPLVDMIMFLLLFGSAAVWAQWPIARCGSHLQENPLRHRKIAEHLVAELPWRAMKGYLLAGFSFASYLMVLVVVIALVEDRPFTLRMGAALAFCFYYGAGILAPAVGVANTVAYAANLRMQMASSGLFSGDLDDTARHAVLTGSVRRPWLVFSVTGLLPSIILVLYVFLAMGGSEAEEQFILFQAIVLLIMAILGSIDLVYTISRTLLRVTRELNTGLRYLSQGQFDGKVPVLLDDELGNLARGLNTALSGLRERENLKDALEIASEIQQGLLPQYVPNISGYAMHGFQRSCETVGGDYFDHIELEDGRLWLIVADVAGKGYPAALTVANLQAMLRGLAYLQVPIEDAASYINNTLNETMTGGRFVTLFMGKLQPRTNRLIWINAGHVPPMIMGKDGVNMLEATAPPMGLTPDVSFEVMSMDLQAGDTLLAYTDGVTEARDKTDKEMFGEARLRQWLEEKHSEPLEELPGLLLETLDTFEGETQQDDMTMLYVRREQV